MKMERRKHPRIETLELVSFENYETTKTELMMGMGKTLDISLGGLCLESRHALPLGSTLKLSVALGEEILEAEGRIVSLTLTEHLTVKVHIQFTSLDEEEREKLERFIKAREQQG